MCIYFFSVGCLWELYICIRLVSFRSLFIEAIVDGAETITHGTNCRRQKQNKIKSIVKFKTTWWRTGIVTFSKAEWERRRTKKTILRPTTLTKIDWRTFGIATSKSFLFFLRTGKFSADVGDQFVWHCRSCFSDCSSRLLSSSGAMQAVQDIQPVDAPTDLNLKMSSNTPIRRSYLFRRLQIFAQSDVRCSLIIEANYRISNNEFHRR